MTRDETKKIVAVIGASYPNHFRDFDARKTDEFINAWHFVMEDVPYDEASAGLKMFLRTDTKGFPPSPGQILAKVDKMREVEYPTAMEAWGLVLKAISNSIYNSEKEFNALPPICQRAIGNAESLHEMAMMDTSTVMSVEQSHFVRNYDRLIEGEKEIAKMPESVRQLVKKTVMSIGVNG